CLANSFRRVNVLEVIVLAVASVGFRPSGALDKANIPWERRLREEAPKKWKEYELKSRSLQGRCAVRFRSLVGKHAKEETRFKLMQAEGCALVVEEPGDEPKGYLRAIGRQYQFSLVRSRPDSPWALRGLGKDLWKSGTFNDPATLTD